MLWVRTMHSFNVKGAYMYVSLHSTSVSGIAETQSTAYFLKYYSNTATLIVYMSLTPSMHLRWSSVTSTEAIGPALLKFLALWHFSESASDPRPTYAMKPSVSVGLKFIKDFS